MVAPELAGGVTTVCAVPSGAMYDCVVISAFAGAVRVFTIIRIEIGVMIVHGENREFERAGVGFEHSRGADQNRREGRFHHHFL